MSVTLYEGALRALLETQEGPVGQFVQREAEKVKEAMRDDIRSYFKGAETTVEDDVALRMDGSTATVGLQDDPQGRSRKLESKAARYARLGDFRLTKAAAGIG
jgi:hypothetical protein